MYKSRREREGAYWGKLHGKHYRVHGASRWNLSRAGYTLDGTPIKWGR